MVKNGKKNKGKAAQERLKAKKEKQKKIFFGVLAAVVLAMIVVGIVLMNVGGGGNDDVDYRESQVDANNENVVITISEVDDGTFHYYSYDKGATEIKYFIVLSEDGEIHTAFDACDVCYHSKKGYSQAGDEATCNNCGLSYPVDDLGTKNTGGGCWPGMLLRTVESGKIYIKITDLEAGEYYFK